MRQRWPGPNSYATLRGPLMASGVGCTMKDRQLDEKPGTRSSDPGALWIPARPAGRCSPDGAAAGGGDIGELDRPTWIGIPTSIRPASPAVGAFVLVCRQFDGRGRASTERPLRAPFRGNEQEMWTY